jgi:hypothetical protein
MPVTVLVCVMILPKGQNKNGADDLEKKSIQTVLSQNKTKKPI